jgi:hypothetical protein
MGKKRLPLTRTHLLRPLSPPPSSVASRMVFQSCWRPRRANWCRCYGSTGIGGVGDDEGRARVVCCLR